MGKKFFNRLSINEPRSLYPAEHEIFLSFTNDDEAVSFYEWLNSEGLALFQEYLDRERQK